MKKVWRTYLRLVGFLLSVLLLSKSDVHSASPLLTYRVVDLGTLEQAVGGMVRGPTRQTKLLARPSLPGLE